MYKPSEFAKLINVTTQTLRNWEKSGKLIPIHLPSGHRRYTEEQLQTIKK
jgi:DNA-binding transcriptional MerR regulator